MGIGMMGAVLGLLLAVVDIFLLRALSARVELPETRRVLAVTGIVQLVLLPIMGYFVAPLFAGE